jgi:molybdate/tungstate transport system substrate-binding protein
MIIITAKRAARAGAFLALSCLGLAAAGCGSSSSSSPSSQTASVAYASSLQYLNEKVAGPAFHKAEGYQYSGRGGESGALQMEISAHEISPNVFQVVGGDNIMPLMPKFTKWYVQYAHNAMVVAYNPKSKYASQFEAIASGKEPVQKLFLLMEKPGFKLGRTDPNLDPQGRAFIYMLELAQAQYHLPADTVTKILGGPLASPTSPEIFAESSLDATLESGQLDAASAYYTQAKELHLHYIPLPNSINLSDFALANHYATAHITITDDGVKTPKTGSPLVIDATIIGKPTNAGIAFLKYTLSPAGLAQYKAAGFTLLKPTVFGSMSAVPAAIRSELGG